MTNKKFNLRLPRDVDKWLGKVSKSKRISKNKLIITLLEGIEYEQPLREVASKLSRMIHESAMSNNSIATISTEITSLSMRMDQITGALLQIAKRKK